MAECLNCITNGIHKVGEKVTNYQQRTCDWHSANFVGAKKVTEYLHLRIGGNEGVALKTLKVFGAILATILMWPTLGLFTLAKWSFEKTCDGLSCVSKKLCGSTSSNPAPVQGAANPPAAPAPAPSEGNPPAASVAQPKVEELVPEVEAAPAAAPEATGTEGPAVAEQPEG